jgi:hypothetical protein
MNLMFAGRDGAFVPCNDGDDGNAADGRQMSAQRPAQQLRGCARPQRYGGIASPPAGDDFIGALVFAYVLLLVGDIPGFPRVNSFTRSVNT